MVYYVLSQDTNMTRVLIKEVNISTASEEMKFFDTFGTGYGENNPPCIN